MSPSTMRFVIPASAPASAAADLAAPRAAPGRGIGTAQPGGQPAQAPTGPTAAPAPDAAAATANTDSPGVAAGTSSAPTPATFGQTLAASKAKPAAPARSAARKPAAPPSISPEMVLASLSAASAPATAADPASANAPRGNSASPEAAASTNAVPAGTASPAAAANVLQGLPLTISDEAASEPEAPVSDTAESTTAASDSVSDRSGGAASKAAAVLTPAPAATAFMAHGFQTSGDPSGRTAAEDPTAAPDADTGAALHADTAALATGTAHPKIEQFAVTAPGPSGSGDGALTGPPAATSALTAAASAGAQATATPAPQAPAGPTVQVQAPVGSSAFPHEIGMHLHLLAQQGISSASLRLTPAQLGPVEVKISVHENAASVWFGAAQPETRSALELSLPKLRDLFASHGLNLAQAGVSDQSARGARREPQPAVAVAQSVTRAANATHVTSVQPARQGLLDLYA